MGKFPSVYGLRGLYELAHAPTVSVRIGDKYVPARPSGWPSLRNRFRCAWLVFTGRADAVIWPEEANTQPKDAGHGK